MLLCAFHSVVLNLVGNVKATNETTEGYNVMLQCDVPSSRCNKRLLCVVCTGEEMPFIRSQAWLSGCCAPSTGAFPSPGQLHGHHSHSGGAPVPPAASPPALSFWLSVEHPKPQTVSWRNTVNHMGNACHICHRLELVVPRAAHVDCRKLSHTELCQGLLGTGQGSAMASSSSGCRGSCLVVPDMNPFCHHLPSSKMCFPMPAYVQSIRSDKPLYRELVGAFDLLCNWKHLKHSPLISQSSFLMQYVVDLDFSNILASLIPI